MLIWSDVLDYYAADDTFSVKVPDFLYSLIVLLTVHRGEINLGPPPDSSVTAPVFKYSSDLFFLAAIS